MIIIISATFSCVEGREAKLKAAFRSVAQLVFMGGSPFMTPFGMIRFCGWINGRTTEEKKTTTSTGWVTRGSRC